MTARRIIFAGVISTPATIAATREHFAVRALIGLRSNGMRAKSLASFALISNALTALGLRGRVQHWH